MNFKRISCLTFVLSSLFITDSNSMENKLNNTLYYIPNKNIDNISSSVVISFKENGICSAKECIGDEVRKKRITINKLSTEFNNIFNYSCSVSSISSVGYYLFIKDLYFKRNLKKFLIGNFTNTNPTVIISNISTYTNQDCILYVQNIHELIFESGNYNNHVYFKGINNLGKNDVKILYNTINIGEDAYNYKEDGIITIHPGKNIISPEKYPEELDNISTKATV